MNCVGRAHLPQSVKPRYWLRSVALRCFERGRRGLRYSPQSLPTCRRCIAHVDRFIRLSTRIVCEQRGRFVCCAVHLHALCAAFVSNRIGSRTEVASIARGVQRRTIRIVELRVRGGSRSMTLFDAVKHSRNGVLQMHQRTRSKGDETAQAPWPLRIRVDSGGCCVALGLGPSLDHCILMASNILGVSRAILASRRKQLQHSSDP